MDDADTAARLTGTPATESRHPDSFELDRMSALEILTLLNREDHVAVEAVADILPAMAALVDDAVGRLRGGGRVHYFGAGTSGRLGLLDSVELPPTFGVTSGMFQAHLAGGSTAIRHAVEGAEDSDDDGRQAALGTVRQGDLAVGMTVSGTTPYVGGALAVAREIGAGTALFTSNPDTPFTALCDHLLVADTGPEVLTGSTRLKAGTATKLMLNGFSTAVMVLLGRTYSNLMVSVLATNEKLRLRTLRILGEVTGESAQASARRLEGAGDDLAVAVVAAVTGTSAEAARTALTSSGRAVREAVLGLSTEVT